MFSLIVVIISIALVAALIAATVYFGGSTFSSGAVKAEVARITNEASQITAAAHIHRVTEGRSAANINELVASSHLAAPPNPSWQTYQEAAVTSDVTEQQCEALNAQVGITSIPSCADPAIVNLAVCCNDAPQ